MKKPIVWTLGAIVKAIEWVWDHTYLIMAIILTFAAIISLLIGMIENNSRAIGGAILFGLGALGAYMEA